MAEGWKTRTVKEKLPCALSDAEIQARGEELAKQERELATLQEERKLASRTFAKGIADVRAVVTRLANDIARKAEDRDVSVEIRVDHETSTKRFVRLDTNETVREEALGLQEVEEARQRDMFPANDEDIEAKAEEERAIEELDLGDGIDQTVPEGEGAGDAGNQPAEPAEAPEEPTAPRAIRGWKCIRDGCEGVPGLRHCAEHAEDLLPTFCEAANCYDDQIPGSEFCMKHAPPAATQKSKKAKRAGKGA